MTNGTKNIVKCVIVLAVKLLLNHTKCFTETLEVINFTLTKELNWVGNFWVFYKTKNVVVGGTRLLFCCKVFKEVCDWVPLALEFASVEWNTTCSLRPDTARMVDIISSKSRFFQFFCTTSLGQLTNNSSNHFHVSKFLCTNIRKKTCYFFIIHRISL